jgi:hypothetical protein
MNQQEPTTKTVYNENDLYIIDHEERRRLDLYKNKGRGQTIRLSNTEDDWKRNLW